MKKWYKILIAYDGKSVGDKVQLEEAQAKSLVDAKILELTEEDPVDSAIAAATKSLEDKISQMVDMAVAKTLEAVSGKKKKKSKSIAGGGGASDDNDDDTIIETKDLRNRDLCGYKSRGAFLHDIVALARDHQMPESLKKYQEYQTNALAEARVKAPTGQNETVSEEGHLLVIPDISNRILEKMFATQELMPMVDMYTVGGNSMAFKTLKEDSRVAGSRYGGITSAWLDEGAQLTASKASWETLNLKLHKMGAFCAVTDELLDDATGVSLDQFLTRMASQEILFRVSDAIIRGDSIHKPQGIIGHAGTLSIAKETGQAAATIVGANVSKMWMRCPASLRNQAVWLINPDCEAQLEQLNYSILFKNVAGTENVGGFAFPLYTPPGGINNSPNGMLKGRPIIWSEYCDTCGTQGDIILAVLNQYLCITKGGIRTAMSIHLRFDFDEMVFRFIFRVDGRPWWKTPVTPYKGTSTISPFIVVDNR